MATFDPNCDNISDLVAPIPQPTNEQIKVGSLAIDAYYDNTKDAPFEGSVAYVYRSMKALEPDTPSGTDDLVESGALSHTKDHIARIRQKVQTADGLGPFWRGMMLAALGAIDAQRERNDKYGLALMMIGEGAAEPAKFARETIEKHRPR